MALMSIHLTLARDPHFPQGSDRHGYDFVAPLDGSGHLDPEEWRKSREKCRVRRFWEGEDDEVGHLIHTQGRTWAFHYDIEGAEEDDESGYRFDSHPFKVGEYVSIREQDGETRTFRVASVRPAAM
jgi:hypothetical protein